MPEKFYRFRKFQFYDSPIKSMDQKDLMDLQVISFNSMIVRLKEKPALC